MSRYVHRQQLTRIRDLVTAISRMTQQIMKKKYGEGGRHGSRLRGSGPPLRLPSITTLTIRVHRTKPGIH